MKVDYPKLNIPPHIARFLCEIDNGIIKGRLLNNWTGILIYHPATNSYYSSKSNDPGKYESIVREKTPTKWPSIALALRKLLDVDPNFQFFALPLIARAEVESWMASIGKRRVATKMGEKTNVIHVMFEVTSIYNKVTRYLVAPLTTSREEIIKAVNKGMANWLKSTSPAYHNERSTLQIALRSRSQINKEVFEPESSVIATNLLDGYTHNQFRNRCMMLNAEAARDFVRATTGR